MARTVLITGVSRHLGGAYARRLSREESVDRIIGVDVVPPRHGIGRAEFVRADIRSPLITRILTDNEVDTVVHMSVIATPAASGGRTSQKEINVIGTMQLLAACQKAENLRSLVVQSSVSVYGSSPRDPARFTEEMTARTRPRTGFGKDSVEIESYVRGLARRRPDISVTTLRLANLMGAGVDSHVTRYLSLPVVPRVMGFDARLQFLHPADAVDALALVTRRDVPGTYNVGADDVVALSQAIRMMGRPAVGVPQQLAPTVAGLSRSARLLDFTTDQLDALTYGRAMDTTRFAEAAGYTPRYTSRAALEEFVALAPQGMLSSERVDHALDSVSRLLSSVEGTRRG